MNIRKKISNFGINFDNYIIKLIIYMTILIFVIVALIFYMLTNYTTVIEESLLKVIATTDGYEYNYDGDYFTLKKYDDNNEEVANIIYRYDEENFSTFIDKNKKSNTGLYVANVAKDDSIQSENNVLLNIENEFDDFKLRQTDGYGGGYTIQSIHKVFNFHRIVYKSNLPVDRDDILKNIIELEPIDTSSIIYYHGDEETFSDILEKEYLDKKERELIQRGLSGEILKEELEKEKYRYEAINRKDKLDELSEEQPTQEYSTYNMIVLAPESEQELSINSDNNYYVNDNTGAIVGCCINDDEISSKMRWTIYKIEVITLLQKTILL